MSESLYAMSEAYTAAFNDLMTMEDMDEQTIADTLEGLQGELHEKMLNVAKWQQGLEAEATAIKNAIGKMQERMKSKQKQAERLKAYLSDLMLKTGETKVSDPFVSLSFRKSESVAVTEGALDDEWLVEKISQSPNKVAIKKALKNGAKIKGAQLIVNNNLQIK